MTNVAVIGAGNIGGTLARKWSRAGHRVIFGARDPASPTLRGLADEIGARTASIAEAIGASEVALLAIPGAAMAETVASVGADLDGKAVIDATNNIGGESMNSAATIARAAPGAPYFRAFNTLGWELFDEPTVGGSRRTSSTVVPTAVPPLLDGHDEGVDHHAAPLRAGVLRAEDLDHDGVGP